ncbi:hypothetical protein O6H91_20G014000 [Diphasiastrum complanatum]|nr:hypothetical protein O6H91_20G014000 [Diphasiastrum complanatum]KAJ7518890.1 hypothetical protein O6H91_20G014000 [Diphasiastrum complanatum]KAJ7518893.1 hypothetical protein O6H91_20G014000 [Diphasiastrum complanatum]
MTSRRRSFDAARIINQLRETFESGCTKKAEWRSQQLKSILRMVKEHERDIAEAVFKDLGRPPHQTFADEILSVIGTCKLALKELKAWMTPKKGLSLLWSYYSEGAIYPEPFGVTLVISAWGFPVLFALDPLIGAIAAGNAVVLKPSELTPATSTLLANIVPQYLDPCAIRIIDGSGSETRKLLAQKWDKVFCSGSPSFCKTVMAASAKFLTPITVELVGKCPAIVDSTADLKVAARQIVCGKWANNNGQTCISPDYVIAEHSIASEFIGAVKDTLKDLYGEDPHISASLSRIASFSHFARLTGLLDDPVLSGKVIYGGQRDAKCLYIAPTMILNPPLESALMKEEIFGPLLPVITVDTMQQAIQIMKSLPKSLAIYVFTNKRTCEEKIRDTCAANFVLNNTISTFISNPQLEFGFSGEWIRAHQVRGLFESFSYQKVVIPKSREGGNVTKVAFMLFQTFLKNILIFLNSIMLKLKSYIREKTFT